MMIRNAGTREATLRFLILSLIAIAPAGLPGQNAGGVQFEVASVKRVHDGPPPGDIPRNLDSSPGHLAMRNVPLRHAVLWAYDLKDYQVTGPDWIKGDERYDIIAKAAGPVAESQIRLMLQRLLTERFQLKLRREAREMSVYVLGRGKGEPKVNESSGDRAPALAGSPTAVKFHRQPISRFTFMLTRRLDRPVLDATGLTGLYDFTIDVSGLGFNGRPAEDQTAPSVFTTVQRDLNLKLEARKESIDVLVIESANRIPVEN
jgi:uncharacterized protein (TIGR03435 family)